MAWQVYKPASGMPASGIPAKGEGWGGPARHGPSHGDIATLAPARKAWSERTTEEKRAHREMREVQAEEAMDFLIDVVRDKSCHVTTRVIAAEKFCDRVHGKPAQRVDADRGDSPIQIVLSELDAAL